MALLNPDKLWSAIERGERGGVFFLFGEEEHLKEEFAARIVAAHLDPATRDFNLDQLRGDSLTPEQILSIAQTPPMMAEWRVVVVRDAQALAGSSKLRDAIDQLTAREIPGLALVLVAQLPGKTKAKFYDRLKKEARAVEFAPLGAADLPGWLMQRAQEDGVTLEPAAARALPAAIGTELGVLVSELTKLRDYVGERATITVQDIEEAVGPIARYNRWEWFDMVGERRFREAREALPILLEMGGESGVGLIIGLGTQVLRLALAKCGDAALGDALPPHQRWLARRFSQQARGWGADELDAALDDLLRADRLLKSASLNDAQVLEDTLLRLEARNRKAA